MKVEHQKEKNRFLLLDKTGKRAGYIMYEEVAPGLVSATHTKVYPAYEGKGYGAMLLDALAAWAEGAGVKIRPVCPYVAKMFQRYPEKYAAVIGE